MVMDLRSMGLACDNHQVKSKELEEFNRKMNILTKEELASALQVTRSDMLHVLNQVVPCVGCRRSVERLYYHFFKNGHPTLDPIVVRPDGFITIHEDKQTPQVLCGLFHGHSARLNSLVDNQIRRNKKSPRCILHSLDSQRSRPITPTWRDVWDCMKPECKRDSCIIEASTLHTTLETYLRKHRFCGECRTKVLKAYTLLVEDPEPCKEKGYVAGLYSGIKRCLPDKHIHLQTKTDYITKLIGRAEPELLGSRRERHAKTLEIAQEEVLTCLGICMYERLHRIYMRMREEECTCQVFAAVAVDALCRSFETAVEHTQGISQLELLYVELTRKEQQKQLRREQKKLKRKRKKGRAAKETNGCDKCKDDEEEEEELEDCSCSSTKSDKGCQPADGKKKDPLVKKNNLEATRRWVDDCKCEKEKKKNSKKKYNNSSSNSSNDNGYDAYLGDDEHKKENGSSSDHSHDCGYSSENGNGNGCCETGSLTSSLPSSPDGSEMACSDGCCQTEQDYVPYSRFSYGNGQQLSLQEMLEDHFYSDDDSDCYITAEEVLEFKTNNRQVCEKRRELRETLQKRFAHLCVYGPTEVPRVLTQSK
ncbi:gametogenetin-binding protein 2-like isoform X2 [Agrilus planipennis]|nr:gametogenetin-binding protein 2-like isoform X2 [Agrilus planipennis]